MFSFLKDTFKKSEAAALAAKLLDFQKKNGLWNLNSNKFANEIVHMLWEQKPEVFQGKTGVRPHKMASTAMALCNGFIILEGDSRNKLAVLAALANVLTESSENRSKYGFSHLDEELFERASFLLNKFSLEVEQAQNMGSQIDAAVFSRK